MEWSAMARQYQPLRGYAVRMQASAQPAPARQSWGRQSQASAEEASAGSFTARVYPAFEAFGVRVPHAPPVVIVTRATREEAFSEAVSLTMSYEADRRVRRVVPMTARELGRQLMVGVALPLALAGTLVLLALAR